MNVWAGSWTRRYPTTELSLFCSTRPISAQNGSPVKKFIWKGSSRQMTVCEDGIVLSYSGGLSALKRHIQCAQVCGEGSNIRVVSTFIL